MTQKCVIVCTCCHYCEAKESGVTKAQASMFLLFLLMLSCLSLSSSYYPTQSNKEHTASNPIVKGHNKCVIAVVDTAHGLASEIVKLHSLLMSTQRSHELYFGFLVANNIEVGIMREAINQCTMNITYGIKVIETFPSFMLKFMRHDKKKTSQKWYTPGVFGNFLLPQEFPECNYLMYLDNDMFMNLDVVTDVFEKVSLTRKDHKSGRIVPTHTGIYFEKCHQSGVIRHDQFNTSHPFVRERLGHVDNYLYINNGIMIMNATLWREKNVTEEMWDAIRLAQTEPLFTVNHRKMNKRPDDQMVQMLVLGANATHLPKTLNMRRNCGRLAYHLEHHKLLGIIHLAGTTKSCSAAFPGPPMAMMTSIVHSLSQVCNISPRLLDDCRRTVDRFKRHNASFPALRGGLGNFTFPPAGNFTYLPHPVANGRL